MPDTSGDAAQGSADIDSSWAGAPASVPGQTQHAASPGACEKEAAHRAASALPSTVPDQPPMVFEAVGRFAVAAAERAAPAEPPAVLAPGTAAALAQSAGAGRADTASPGDAAVLRPALHAGAFFSVFDACRQSTHGELASPLAACMTGPPSMLKQVRWAAQPCPPALYTQGR